ncbi:hypothetical protein GCM10010449_40050 [Streptomyces rectiviolaceus]|uniref:Uncharacterized protein n=2 Tax=Streptomyces rectiviolaceus TaxID=332591 RepID=A0ABP6MHA7_9ACTN
MHLRHQLPQEVLAELYDVDRLTVSTAISGCMSGSRKRASRAATLSCMSAGVGYSGRPEYARPSGARFTLPSILSMTVEQRAGSNEQVAARQQSEGTTSLVLSAVAAAMMVCPLLPVPVPKWILFLPVYFTVPVGISAVISGIGALRRMRGQEEADRFRARAGVALGTAVVMIPLTVIVWTIWAMSQDQTYE